MNRPVQDSENKKSAPIGEHTGDSDIVSFWLLLLFIAVFFGVAAEEARRPMFASASKTVLNLGSDSFDVRGKAARSQDLLSVEQEGADGAPATGK